MSDWVKVAQSCLALCDPMDCSPTGSSFHGILQARILEWVAISFSRGSSWPRGWTRVSCIFTIWATREALRRVTVLFIAFFLHVYILAFLSTINKDLFLKTRTNESKFFEIFFPNKNEYLFLWPLLIKYIWRLLQITQRYGDNTGVFAEDSSTLWLLFSYNY